jgi:hypothetical protein
MKMISLKLGILYKGTDIVNHRSLLKVLLNPVLRYFGFCIATKCNDNKLGKICLVKQLRAKKIKWDFNNCNDYDYILKKRLLI